MKRKKTTNFAYYRKKGIRRSFKFGGKRGSLDVLSARDREGTVIDVLRGFAAKVREQNYHPDEDILRRQRQGQAMRVRPFGLNAVLEPTPPTKGMSDPRKAAELKEKYWKGQRHHGVIQCRWYFIEGDMQSKNSLCLLFTTDEAQFREKVGKTLIFSCSYGSKDQAMKAWQLKSISWSGGVRTED